MIKVSVIIPVYNGEGHLPLCLHSVIRQKYPLHEIIIVDNHSTDGTPNIIRSFQKKNDKVRYVFEKFRSRGAARNRGIQEATGDIIAMTDSDCVVPIDWVQKMIAPIINKNESLVMGGEKNIICNMWSENMHALHESYYKKFIHGSYIYMLDTKNFFVKRDVIKKYMFADKIRHAEDFEFSLRIYNKEKIYYLSQTKVIHFNRMSLIAHARNIFEHSYWMGRACKNINKAPNFCRDVLLCQGNYWTFLKYLAAEFSHVKRKRFYFNTVTEIARRVGLYYA